MSYCLLFCVYFQSSWCYPLVVTMLMSMLYMCLCLVLTTLGYPASNMDRFNIELDVQENRIPPPIQQKFNPIQEGDDFPNSKGKQHNVRSQSVTKAYADIMYFLQSMGLDVDWKPVIELESHKKPGFWEEIEEAPTQSMPSSPSLSHKAMQELHKRGSRSLPDIPPKMLKFLIAKMIQQGMTDADLLGPSRHQDISVGLDLKTISQMIKADWRHKFVKNIDASLKSLGK